MASLYATFVTDTYLLQCTNDEVNLSFTFVISGVIPCSLYQGLTIETFKQRKMVDYSSKFWPNVTAENKGETFLSLIVHSHCLCQSDGTSAFVSATLPPDIS